MTSVYHAEQLPLFPMRVCRKCGNEYSLDNLHFPGARANKLKYTCLECSRKLAVEGNAKLTPEERSARSVKGGKAPKPSRKGKPFSDEWKQKLSESHMGHPCHLSDEQKKANGKRFAAYNTERNAEHNRMPHRRAQSGENIRRSWQEKPEQMYKGRHFGIMTSIEKKVWPVLEPLGFRYESRHLRYNGKILVPDFVRDNLIVEMLGSYWHNEEETAQRIAILEECGFKVLTIWDYELRYTKECPPEVKEKIEMWCKEMEA